MHRATNAVPTRRKGGIWERVNSDVVVVHELKPQLCRLLACLGAATSEWRCDGPKSIQECGREIYRLDAEFPAAGILGHTRRRGRGCKEGLTDDLMPKAGAEDVDARMFMIYVCASC